MADLKLEELLDNKKTGESIISKHFGIETTVTAQDQGLLNFPAYKEGVKLDNPRHDLEWK
ncbi:MAG: hypothetical protein KDJ35_05170 [Alphaproteobacteria bacterium]|nr:hypothetical protein [Alphaproteobacteria bacterium]